MQLVLVIMPCLLKAKGSYAKYYGATICFNRWSEFKTFVIILGGLLLAAM
jgi:hypothetical protein